MTRPASIQLKWMLDVKLKTLEYLTDVEFICAAQWFFSSLHFHCIFSLAFSIFSLTLLLSLISFAYWGSVKQSQGSLASVANKKGTFPISLLSHLFTHMNIFRMHQLFILTISRSFSVYMFAKTWSKTPNHKKQLKNLETFFVWLFHDWCWIWTGFSHLVIFPMPLL